jgi:transposase
MDLLLEKQYPQKEIEKAYHILQFKNEPLELVGTAGLKRQLYPADYDFLSKVKFLKTKEMYNEFKKILDNIQQQNNLYFIEFKFQNKDESKFKIYSINDFTLKTFYKHFKPSKIDYCKIDLIINLENTNDFKEVSVIYFLKKKNDEDITKEKYILELEDDYKGLIKEKKYYEKYLHIAVVKSDSSSETAKDKAVYLVGLNLSLEERNVSEYLVESVSS